MGNKQTQLIIHHNVTVIIDIPESVILKIRFPLISLHYHDLSNRLVSNLIYFFFLSLDLRLAKNNGKIYMINWVTKKMKKPSSQEQVIEETHTPSKRCLSL